MVRSAATRKAKYDAKIDGDVQNQRITALKPMMVEQIHEKFTLQSYYEDKTKRYLERIGMYGLQQHHYMNYMQGLWARFNSFGQRTLLLEAEAWASHWLRRGLTAAHLIHIATFFNIDLTAWP